MANSSDDRRDGGFLSPYPAKKPAEASNPRRIDPDAGKLPTVPQSARTLEISTSLRHPHYVAEHLGSPCTLGALDHELECGHKVLTDQPENCASNCKCTASDLQNDRKGRPFVCLACTTLEVQEKHDANARSFQADLEAVASAAGKILQKDEIVRRLEVMEIGWQELDSMTIKERAKPGRLARPFVVEPGYEEAIEAMFEESTAIGAPRENSGTPDQPKDAGKEVCVDSSPAMAASISPSESTSVSTSTSSPKPRSRKSRLPVIQK